MSQRPRPLNAWKHGGYSNLGVLPGEDPREFDRLHKSLIDEWEPSGPTEHDAVLGMAKCMWRKSRLTIYAHAQAQKILATDFEDPLQDAWDAYAKVANEGRFPSPSDESKRALEVEREDSVKQYVEQQIEKQVAELDEQLITPASLVKEIELEDRLDARIDRLVKRLFQLKTGKQMLRLGSRSHDAPSPVRKLPLLIEQGTAVGQIAVDVGPACATIGCNTARRRSRPRADSGAVAVTPRASRQRSAGS
jgi:hypothetical protein